MAHPPRCSCFHPNHRQSHRCRCRWNRYRYCHRPHLQQPARKAYCCCWRCHHLSSLCWSRLLLHRSLHQSWLWWFPWWSCRIRHRRSPCSGSAWCCRRHPWWSCWSSWWRCRRHPYCSSRCLSQNRQHCRPYPRWYCPQSWFPWWRR